MLWKDVINWLTQLYGSKWPHFSPPAELTLIKTMTTVQQKYRSLVLKRNSVNLSNFCDTKFGLPISKDKVKKMVLPKSQKNCGVVYKKSLHFRKNNLKHMEC